ncbi:MAG: DUF1707 domain-containing protein [Acidimicrobiales bacterium]
MSAALSASTRPPTEQARTVAVVTVLAACRSGHLDLAAAEERLDAVYSARTFADLHRATAGLPDPPAPFLLPTSD